MPPALVRVAGPSQEANDAFCTALQGRLAGRVVYCVRNLLFTRELPEYPDVVVLACFGADASRLQVPERYAKRVLAVLFNATYDDAAAAGERVIRQDRRALQAFVDECAAQI